MRAREFGTENEAKWDEPDDIDGDILPITPAWIKFIPWQFQKLLMQDEKALRD